MCAPAENRTVSASFQSRQEDARQRLGRAGRTEPVAFYIPFGTSSELDRREEVPVSDDVSMGCQHVPTLAPADVVSTEQELCLRGVGPWNA